jgi:hypothetical protein
MPVSSMAFEGRGLRRESAIGPEFQISPLVATVRHCRRVKLKAVVVVATSRQNRDVATQNVYVSVTLLELGRQSRRLTHHHRRSH